MRRRSPKSTLNDTLFPYTTLFLAMVVGTQRCVHPRRTGQAQAIGRDAADVLLGAGTIAGRLARGNEPQPPVQRARSTSGLRRRAVGRPRAATNDQARGGTRPRRWEKG